MNTNIIYCGDNLEVLPNHVAENSIDLIYIDPPFNSNRVYEVFWGEGVERRAFEDRYGDAMAYLDWMRPRLHQLYRVLKSNGTFYYLSLRLARLALRESRARPHLRREQPRQRDHLEAPDRAQRHRPGFEAPGPPT